MDREGFRNRLKQYKQAREENPGLKYWEWKNIPKYDEGTDGVTGPPTQEEMFKNKPTVFKDIASDPVIYDYIKEQSGRARYERAAHHASSGDLHNVASYLWNKNEDNKPYYTGSIIKSFDPEADEYYNESVVQGNEPIGQWIMNSRPNEQRDLVKNFIYGEDEGFKKSNKKPLTINGEIYKERQYDGTIAPIDTLFLPKSMQPTIDSLITEKQIYNMNHNYGYSPSIYRQDRQKEYSIDNVANHSGVFRKKGNKYSAELFDLWDFMGDYPYGLDWIAHKFQNNLAPDNLFPNAGPFVLRQDIPIKFINDSKLDETRRSGKYFLQNLNDESNKASIRLKTHLNKWDK